MAADLVSLGAALLAVGLASALFPASLSTSSGALSFHGLVIPPPSFKILATKSPGIKSGADDASGGREGMFGGVASPISFTV